MKKNVLLIFLMLSLFRCSPPSENDHPFRIVTTTGMIKDAVKNLVQGRAQVVALMGPGVDPHLYKASQGDLGKLTQADMVFYNGLHLEGKMGEVLEKLGRLKPVIAVSEEIDPNRLRSPPEFKGAYDPHIWFDVRLWKEAVKRMGKGLMQHDPANASFYEENLQHYLAVLDTLHENVLKKIQTLPASERNMITAHDAFGYFGQAYGMEVHGLQGISTVSDFGLKDITNLVNFIQEKKIKAIFVETSVSPRSIEAVVEGCNQKGWPVKIGGKLYSDAMGEEGTFEGTYVGMVTTNVNTLVNALQ